MALSARPIVRGLFPVGGGALEIRWSGGRDLPEGSSSIDRPDAQ